MARRPDLLLELFEGAVARVDRDGVVVAATPGFAAWCGTSGQARVEHRGDGPWLVGTGTRPVPVRLVPMADGGALAIPADGEGRAALEAVAGGASRRLDRLAQSLQAHAAMALRENPGPAVAQALEEILAMVAELRAVERLVAGLRPGRAAASAPVELHSLLREAATELTITTEIEMGEHDTSTVVDIDRAQAFSVLAGLVGALARRLPAGERVRADVANGPTVRLALHAPSRLASPLAGVELEAARTVAEAAGGRLLVDPDRGVILELPSASPVSRGGAAVLLVDDDEMVRTLVATGLRREGLEVEEVGNGIAACAAIRDLAHPLLAVVSDLVLPGRGGLAVVAEAARARPGMPAVLVTAHVEAATRKPEGVPVLRKPIDPGALARLLRERISLA